MKKKNTGLIVFYLILIVVIGLLITSFARGTGEGHYKQYSDIVKDFTSENVQAFSISENGKITVQTKPSDEHPEGEIKSYKLLDFSIFYADLGELIQTQLAERKITEYDYEEPSGMSAWISRSSSSFWCFSGSSFSAETEAPS